MAYTGTGTQSDPYIVNNWTDFVALCGKAGAYIAFDPNAEHKVIDMNETERRSGLSGNIALYANVVGNDWEIRNLFANGHWFVGNNNTVKKLHFVNLISSNSKVFQGKLTFESCRFSIMFLSTACFGDSGDSSNLNNCSFHFRFMDNPASSVLFSGYWTLRYCDIILEGPVKGLSLMTVSTQRYCRVTGHIQLNGGTFQIAAGNLRANFDMVAVHVTGTGTVSAQYPSNTVCVVDTEIIDKSLTVSLANNYFGLTTAQMQDPAYLMETMGFPCVEVE